MFLPRHRVGLVVPSANPAFEPELRALLPGQVAIHATRLPVMPGTTLMERNARYLPAYAEALHAFGALPLDARAIGLTGPSYALAPAEDAALQDRLSVTGPVVLPSRAIAAALDALGLRRLVVFSPYPGWLTDRAETYWRAAGLEIAAVFKVSDKASAYELTPDEVVDGLRRLFAQMDDGMGHGAGTAVVMSGTGMPVLDPLAACVADSRAVLLPSNVAIAWALLRHLRLPGSDAFRTVAPALAQLLDASATS